MPETAVLQEPANWLVGGLGSIATVGSAVLFDPTGAAGALIGTALAQSQNLFFISRLGLAAGDRLSGLPNLQPAFMTIWVVSLALSITLAVDRLWDGYKERLQ